MQELCKYHRDQIQQAVNRVYLRSGVIIAHLMDQSVGRALSREYAKDPGKQIDLYRQDMFDHIADWLAASKAAGLPWLDNMDESGAPKKFAKFHDLPSVFMEAERGLQRMAQANPVSEIKPGEEVVVAELESGYRIVSLLSPEALDRESKVMQHCVGLGSYDEGVKDGTISILSLRDPAGKPHVTMEVDVEGKRINQIKGKQNRFPVGKYFDTLFPWLAESGMSVNPHELAGGYFCAEGGAVRHVRDLQPFEVMNHDLMLTFGEGDEPDVVLPEGLVVNGGVKFMTRGTGSITIGKGVKAYHFYAKCGRICGLENISGLDALRLTDVGEVDVPDGTRFSFPVVIDGKTKLDGIVGTSVFENGLTIQEAGDVVIPPSVDVRGELRIERIEGLRVASGASIVGDFSIKSISDSPVVFDPGVSVGGSLSLSGVEAEFSSDLSVAGALVIMYSELDRLPSGMRVGELKLNSVEGLRDFPSDATIEGDVSIIATQLENLGGIRRWPGDLRISKARITSLPHGLEVAGTLEILRSPLTEFPSAMRIGGGFSASSCGAGVIPWDAVIGGSIKLSELKGVRIPDGMVINGGLALGNVEFAEMPTGVVVNGLLNLGTQHVDRITRNITATSYSLEGAKVVDISDLVDIEGDLWVEADQVGMLPDGAKVGGKMIVKGELRDEVPSTTISVAGRAAFFDQATKEALLGAVIAADEARLYDGPHVTRSQAA